MHAAVRAHRRILIPVTCGAGILLAASPGSAQEARLTLAEVVRITLASNPEIRAAEWGVRWEVGAVQQARGAFDPQLRATAAAQRDVNASPAGAEAGDGLAPSAQQMEYGLGVQQKLRSGIVLSPQLSLSRTGALEGVELPRNQATASFEVLVPLGRGRGGGMVTAEERAARLGEAASVFELRHRRAEAVLKAVEAYWSYVASAARLEVHREAEERAQRLVDETRTLVEVDERPAADLVRVRASLASRRAARIAAEQAVSAARMAVGVAMGMGADSMLALPPPAPSFPEADGSMLALVPSAQTVVERALGTRADLASARRREAAAHARLRGARGEMLPRTDLNVRIGYTGIEDGYAWDQLVAPFSGSRNGLHAEVQISTALPVGNRAAEGQALQSAAAAQQAGVEAAGLSRSISLQAATAVETLRRSLEELAQTDDAARLHATAVENESRKFRLGSATLFDVLYAEDGLTSATLARIDGQLRYATALARLQFAAGTLADGEAGERVDVDSLARGRLPALP